MAEIIRLNTGTDVDSALELSDQLKSGQITHGISIYRTVEGNLNYRLFADSKEHITYVIGMMMRMICFFERNYP